MTFEQPRLGLEELQALTLAQRIYRIRDSLGLSQAELAEEVGLDVKSVNRWENEDAEPRRKSRLALEAATGYPESLFRRKVRPSVPATEGHLDDLIRDIRDRLATLEGSLLSLVAEGAEFRQQVLDGFDRLERLEKPSGSGGHPSIARTAQ